MPPATKTTVKVTFYVPRALHKKLKIFAAEHEKTQSLIVTEALEKALKERKDR